MKNSLVIILAAVGIAFYFLFNKKPSTTRVTQPIATSTGTAQPSPTQSGLAKARTNNALNWKQAAAQAGLDAGGAQVQLNLKKLADATKSWFSSTPKNVTTGTSNSGTDKSNATYNPFNNDYGNELSPNGGNTGGGFNTSYDPFADPNAETGSTDYSSFSTSDNPYDATGVSSDYAGELSTPE